MKEIPPGITSLFTRIKAGKIKIRGKFIERYIPGSQAPNPTYWQCQLFKKIKYEDLFKMKNKPDPALLGTSYISN
jgi:hypothetical protein